jgi:site-specific recombinase XerD
MHDLAASKTEQLSMITRCEFNARLITLWLHKFKSAHTRRAYEADIREFVTFIHDKPIDQVTYEDLQEFDEAVASRSRWQGAIECLINRKLAAVRSLLHLWL